MVTRLGPRVACETLTVFWDWVVEEFLAGGSAVPSELARWSGAYRGQGRGAVVLDAFPEPYLGPLDRRPAGVFLALNPGHAHLDFQSRTGVFADEIRTAGSYSAWAASWPYRRDPWIRAKNNLERGRDRLCARSRPDRHRLSSTSLQVNLSPSHGTGGGDDYRQPRVKIGNKNEPHRSGNPSTVKTTTRFRALLNSKGKPESR